MSVRNTTSVVTRLKLVPAASRDICTWRKGGAILVLVGVADYFAVEAGGRGAAHEYLDGADFEHAQQVFLEVVAVQADAVGVEVCGLLAAIGDDEVEKGVAVLEGERVCLFDGHGV